MINEQNAKKALELAEQQRKESNRKHVGNIRRQSKEDLVKIGFSEDQAKKIVIAIHKGKIRNRYVSY